VLSETTSQSVLAAAARAGRLWVALENDTAVGFAHGEVLEPRAAHLEELDVLPAHGRRGLGARLVQHACSWAARNGFDSVTLTTFREVPWNMPFYTRLGFEIVPHSLL